MSEANDVLLGRAGLEQAFAALGERLARRGVVADVFVVGGAAMALAYGATRVTRDVDTRFVPHGIVLEEAGQVAKELGLPPWWLNEQATWRGDSRRSTAAIHRLLPGRADTTKDRCSPARAFRLTSARTEDRRRSIGYAADLPKMDSRRQWVYRPGCE